MLNKININSNKQKLIVYIVLTALTLAVFWQVNHFDFINFDDTFYVTENTHIQSGISLEGIRWAVGTKYADLWNPLVWLSFMLDYQLYGLNAGGYHITNLILHILSTLLLFWLFDRMTKEIWKSAFVAALFALHPLHVESVAWIAERKDVLSAFFWMLTLCLYVYYTQKPAIIRYLLVLFSFVFALLSKPMVITLPLIMILLDYWPLKRFESKKDNLLLWQLKEKITFFILSAALIIITIYDPTSNRLHKFLPLQARIANAPVAFVTYLEKTFWPHDMAVFYPFSEQLPLWQVWVATLLIIVVSIAVIVLAKRLPYLLMGWLWFATTIVPVVGIIQISKHAYAMADRYHYLPSIGIAVMLAWGIPSLIKNEYSRRKILFPAAIAVTIFMAVLTWQQCGYWKNSATLFSHALRVTKNNALAHSNLGIALFAEGKLEEAMYHYNKAILIRPLTPDHTLVYNNRGVVYDKTGQHQRALEDYAKALYLQPDNYLAYYNRGNIYNKFGQYKLAINDYNNTIRLNPHYMTYHNRGIAYYKLRQYEQAIKDFNKTISLKPDFAYAYSNRGIAYFSQGKNEQGCRDAEKSCKLGICKILEAAAAKGLCHGE